jgi:hypothetical protein
MPDIADLVAAMRANPKSVRFADLKKVARSFFGEPRRPGGSHEVFKMPWPGDPRVNIQDVRGQAKAYQVKQVLAAIGRLAELEAAKARDDEGETKEDGDG